MKKICWLIFFLTPSFYSKAQDTLKSDIVSIVLPKQTTRLSVEQAKDKTSAVYLSHPNGFTGNLNIFDINGVVAIMRDDTIRIKDDYDLEWHKSDLDGLQSRTGRSSIRSDIITIGGVRFHIFQTENANGTLIFASDIKDRKMFFCKLVYNLKDRRKAQKAFDEIIKSFKYK